MRRESEMSDRETMAKLQRYGTQFFEGYKRGL